MKSISVSELKARLSAQLRYVQRGQEGWIEVLPTDEFRAHAERLLRRHPLRRADALQVKNSRLFE